MPKNRLVWRKTSFLLNPRNSTISLGSRRVSSKTEVTWQAMPPLKSLIDASSIRGSPPSMGAGSHAWGSGSWTSPLSDPRLGAWLVLCYFDGLWTSSSLEGRGLLGFITSLPFGSLLLLESTCLILEGGGGWGARWGDLGGGGGILGVEKASQLLPSLAGFLTAFEDYVGVSFEYPYLQARLVVVRVN